MCVVLMLVCVCWLLKNTSDDSGVGHVDGVDVWVVVNVMCNSVWC